MVDINTEINNILDSIREHEYNPLDEVEVLFAQDLVPDYVDRSQLRAAGYDSIYSKSGEKTRIFAMLSSKCSATDVIMYFEDKTDLIESFINERLINSYPGAVNTIFKAYNYVWDKALGKMLLTFSGVVNKTEVSKPSLSDWLQAFDPRIQPASAISIGETLRDIKAGYVVE